MKKTNYAIKPELNLMKDRYMKTGMLFFVQRLLN